MFAGEANSMSFDAATRDLLRETQCPIPQLGMTVL